jgi:Zinc-binding dehydrogenase
MDASDGQHEVIDAFCSGEGVEGDDAGSGYAGYVVRGLAFVGWVHVDGQPGSVDQLVAPHASVARHEQPGHGVDLPDVPVLVDRDFDADLGRGDEVLVNGCVDPVPSGVAVGREEDPVGGYVELALALGVEADRIDTIADFAAAQKYAVKTDGGASAGPGARVLAELAALIAEGQLEVPIANVYPLAEVREAYTELERRHTRGKIVLRP